MRAALADGAKNLDHGLVVASCEGKTLAAAYLLDQGANPNVNVPFEGDGISIFWSGYALDRAILNNNIETVELLLNRSANPNVDDFLYDAIRNNYNEIMYLLLNHGATIKNEDNSKNSIITASLSNNAEAIRAILKIENINQNNQSLALYHATQNNNAEAVTALIESGIDPQINNNLAVREAINTNNKEVLDILIKNGAKIDINEIRIIRNSFWRYFFFTRRYSLCLPILQNLEYEPSLYEKIACFCWPLTFLIYILFVIILMMLLSPVLFLGCFVKFDNMGMFISLILMLMAYSMYRFFILLI